MDIIELTAGNILDYIDFVPVDVADYIGRVFVQGYLVLKDGNPGAGMIWEMTNMMVEKPKESHIIWISIKDEAAAKELFAKYRDYIRLDDARKSYFSIPAAVESPEKEALLSEGFSVELSESDEITASLWQISDMPLIKKVPEDKEIRPIRMLSPGEFSDVTKTCAKLGLTGLCEDLIYLPRSYFENDVSCYFQQGDRVGGILLFHRLPSGNLKVMLMASLGKDHSKLLGMMKSALESAMDAYCVDTRLVIDRHNYASLAIGEKLFPHEIGKPVFIGSKIE